VEERNKRRAEERTQINQEKIESGKSKRANDYDEGSFGTGGD
jgi:hypothetical protein